MANKPKFLSEEGLLYFWTAIKNILSEKVDKENGKGLSSNDYSTEEKNKLNNIENGAQVNIIQSIKVNNQTQTINQKNVNITVPLVDSSLKNIGQSADAKATGDALEELSGTIPTKTSELTNDSNYATTDELTDGLATKEDTLQYGTATAEDVGKAMMPKTVANGKVTSWEFGEAGKVDDVQINGTSILENKVANIPIADANALGTVMVADSTHGLRKNAYGKLMISQASSTVIKPGVNSYNPITPYNQHESTFYGLAKAAGHDEKASELPIGQYTDEAKTAIQSMLGVDEFNFSDRIAKGVDDNGDVVEGAIKEGNIANNVASGDYSHAEGQGTIASGPVSHAEGYNTTASGAPSHAEGYNTVASGTNSHAEGYGGTFTINNVSYNSEAKGMADHTEGYQTRTTIGQPGNHAEGYQTAAIGGASHSEGNTTIASGNSSHAEGISTTASGNGSHAEGAGTIASGFQSHAEGFGTIANHKSQHVFGEFNIVDPSSEPATNKGTYVEIVGNGTTYNTRSNARTLDWNGNEVLAGKLTVGVAPTNTMDVSTKGYVDTAIADAVGDITSFEFQVVTELPATGTKGIIYLRAHSHGDNDAYDEYIWVTDRYERLGTLDVDLSGYATTQYVDDELDKKVDDVQINGTSIVTDGVAEIPVASRNNFGVVKLVQYKGVDINANGELQTQVASDANIKSGSTEFAVIDPLHQHESTFYGLAKAAGDTTQSASSNAVGTYTEEAKVAIRNMIDATGESASVTVTGTDPVIQASRNTRYICGEILSLDFTPCSLGICEVIFTSGSSVTVLTLPEAVKMPEWFEVETNHTYEISVVDGVYGAVMVW